MHLKTFTFKNRAGEVFFFLFLVLVSLINTGSLFAETEPANSPPDSPQGRVARRILTLPFREDRVYEVKVGYGVTLELALPEEVRDIVNGDERLVASDYLEKKAYLKGIAYSVGESTSLHINAVSGKTLHLWARIVEPGESDFAFKFSHASNAVFSESHIQKETAKERGKLEREIEKREANLAQATEKLAEEKLKEGMLREEKVLEEGKIKEKDLEIRKLSVTRIGNRLYVKLILKNRSRRDFPVAQILLSRAVTDANDPGKVLGYQEVPLEEPTLESPVIREGEEVGALLSFPASEISRKDTFLLKVIEEGGLGRVVEFKKAGLRLSNGG